MFPMSWSISGLTHLFTTFTAAGGSHNVHGPEESVQNARFQLPTEIWAHICADCTTHDVFSLSCTSKRLRPICVPLLFRSITFIPGFSPQEQLDFVCSTIIAPAVRRLTIRATSHWITQFPAILTEAVSILAVLQCLRHLSTLKACALHGVSLQPRHMQLLADIECLHMTDCELRSRTGVTLNCKSLSIDRSASHRGRFQDSSCVLSHVKINPQRLESFHFKETKLPFGAFSLDSGVYPALKQMSFAVGTATAAQQIFRHTPNIERITIHGLYDSSVIFGEQLGGLCKQVKSLQVQTVHPILVATSIERLVLTRRYSPVELAISTYTFPSVFANLLSLHVQYMSIHGPLESRLSTIFEATPHLRAFATEFLHSEDHSTSSVSDNLSHI